MFDMAFQVDDMRLAPWLNTLRVNANDATRSSDWHAVHAMADDLRRDEAFWTGFWGPYCAVAAWHVAGPDAGVALLQELISQGFHQPEVFATVFRESFSGHPRWPALFEEMSRARPPVPIELESWPQITPAAPLGLFKLPPGKEDVLRGMLPAPAASAWETAQLLLAWTSVQWEHAEGHMDTDDAVACLNAAHAGARFACTEYALVLAQALNALHIPARQVKALQHNYHAGVAKGHTVCEAWIDDLNRWVVLDPQNALFWISPTGQPLGLPELTELQHSGSAAPGHVTLGRPPLADTDAALWFSHFAHANTTAGTVAPAGFIPIFQTGYVRRTARLETDTTRLYPDLSELAVGVGNAEGQLALTLTPAHPYAQGCTVNGSPADAGTWTLSSHPGTHELAIATQTPYGTTSPHNLRYRVR
jgi:hypothetical protein